MSRVIYALTAIVIVAMLVGCSPMPKDAVAKVGSTYITADELNEKVPPSSKFKTFDDELAAKRSALDKMIERKVIVLAAKDDGLDKDSTIQKTIKSSKQRLVLNALYIQEVKDKAQPTEAELEHYIDSLANLQAVEFHALHILVKDEKLANELYDRIMKGEDFTELAKQYSEDPGSGKKGGDLGWFPQGRMVKPFENALLALKPGDISKPVKSQFGWHIIKLLDKRTNDITSIKKKLENDKKRQMDALARKKESKLRDDFIKTTVADANIKYNDDVVKLVVDRVTEAKANLPENAKTQNPKPKFTPDDMKKVLFTYKYGEYTIKGLDTLISQIPPFRFPPMDNPDSVKSFIEKKSPLVQDLLVKRAENINIEKGDEFRKLYNNAVEDALYSAYRKKLNKNIDIPDEELQKYYNEHQNEFLDPEKIKVVEIQVATEKEAKELLSRIKGGADMGKLAEKYTLRKYTKDHGGVLGPFSDKRFSELFNAAKGLKVGDLAGPIPNKGKFSIIKLLERTPSAMKPFEQVKNRIKSKLRRDKAKEAYATWLEQAKTKYGVKVNEEALKATIDASKYPAAPTSAKKPAPPVPKPKRMQVPPKGGK